MKLATTTGDFAGYGLSIEECIKLVHDAGFRYLDFCMGGERFYSNDNWKGEVLKLRDYAESLDMTFVQAHSPDGKIWNAEDAERYVKIATRSIEICEILGIPQVVVHAGYHKGVSSNEFFEKNREFYRRLFPIMEKTGVNVLTENTSSKNLPQELYNHPISAKEMVEFIRYIDHPLIHAVWDTGHANTEGTQYEEIMALGKELYGIHVHDNSGHGDEHTLPYLGIINMDDVMNGLLDVGYQGYFTFEAGGVLRRSNNRHGKRYVFERDTRLLEPTLEMQIDIERLLYTMGKHFLKAYDIFEE